jgi:hypothetical protein
MSNLVHAGSSELEGLGFKNKKVEYFKNAQLTGCQCDMPGLFFILSEPLTLQHQTGGGLVNWILHKKAAMDYAVVILVFGVIQKNYNKFQSNQLVCRPRNASIFSQIQGKSASCSTSGFCYYDLISELHHMFLLSFSKVLCFIFHSAKKNY